MGNTVTFTFEPQRSATSIIMEIAGRYIIDPKRRALTPHGLCKYFIEGEPDGDHGTAPDRVCAVGYGMSDPDAFADVQGPLAAAVADALMSRGWPLIPNAHDLFLKPEYRGHGSNFWQALQHFHDSPPHWDDAGLTDSGREALIDLLHTYH